MNDNDDLKKRNIFYPGNKYDDSYKYFLIVLLNIFCIVVLYPVCAPLGLIVNFIGLLRITRNKK